MRRRNGREREGEVRPPRGAELEAGELLAKGGAALAEVERRFAGHLGARSRRAVCASPEDEEDRGRDSVGGHGVGQRDEEMPSSCPVRLSERDERGDKKQVARDCGLVRTGHG